MEAECQLTGDTATARRRIDEIATDGNWVGENVILAMTDYLQRQICVFFASDTASPLTYSLMASDTCGVVNDPIRIAFYEPGHFRAVASKICSKPTASSATMDAIHVNTPTTCRLSENCIPPAIYDHLSTDLSLMHFNARSIKCTFSDISAKLSALDLFTDVIFITETCNV